MIFSMLAYALIAAHVARRRWQVIAALGALTFGVASLTALASANRAVVENAYASVARLSPDVNLQIAAPSPFSASIAFLARRLRGVAAIRPVLERTIEVQTASGQHVMARFIGTDLLSPVFVDERARTALLPGPYSPSGVAATPAKIAVEASVVVNERFSEIAAAGTSDTLVLGAGAGRRSVRILAVVRDDEIGSSDPRIFGDIDNAQRWLGRGSEVDRIDLVVDPARLERVRAFLARHIPGALRVSEPRARTLAIIDSTRGIAFALQTIGVFAVLLALLAAYNLFGVAVIQRRQDVATLRSLGVARGELLRTFAAEAFAYGLIGSVLGLSGGMLFAATNVSRAVALADPLASSPPIVVEGNVALLLFLCGTAAAVLAACIPAVRGLSQEPLAERQDPFENGRAALRTLFAACVGAASAVGAAMLARSTGQAVYLSLGFAIMAAAAALCAGPLASTALRVAGASRARRADVRIAAALADAHGGRTFFASLPIVAAVSALCLAAMLIASDAATFERATRLVFGVDAAAISRGFSLTYALLGGAMILLMAISAIAIGSIWFSALLERRSSYATLRSLGMDDRVALASICFEVGAVASWSAVAGLIAGAADFGLIILSRVPVVSGLPVWRFPLWSFVGWAIVVLLIACLAAFPAALIVSRGPFRVAADQ